MNKINRNKKNERMYQAILSLKTLEECEMFFDDLCTVTELQAMEQRFHVAECLSKGMIYNDVQRYHQPCQPFFAVWQGRI